MIAEIPPSQIIQNLNETVYVATRLPDNRASSEPFVSGDTFRAHADFIFDETQQPFAPEDVAFGSTVFVKGDLLQKFLRKVHPLIQQPYVLITHNSDEASPGPFGALLDDPKILAWFGQNADTHHPKLHPIPIGIANRYWAHGDTEVFDAVKAQGYPKTTLLYLNFSINPVYTKPVLEERTKVYHQFALQPFCLPAFPKDLQSYLRETAMSKFVLSPRGNGLDCHRTWEALYMGSIPILHTSTLDPMFENLPVLLIEDWDQVTKEFLETKYEEMQNRSYQWKKLTAAYWIEQINGFKK